MKWLKTWALNFYEIKDPQAWQNEVDLTFPGITDEEIDKALRRYVETVDTAHRATMRDLRQAIKSWRRDSRHDPDTVSSCRCGGKGLYIAYLPEHPNSIPESVYSVARFCGCDKGQALKATQDFKQRASN